MWQDIYSMRSPLTDEYKRDDEKDIDVQVMGVTKV